MRILRAADYQTMPWKNGMGSTTQIAISPAGAGVDDFDWRVSMAQVNHDGPFSSFPQIDRTLAVLSGAGIDLVVSGNGPIRIDHDQLLAFPGDEPTTATLIDGPIVDLNVMTRRNVVTHQVRRITVSQQQTLEISRQTLVFVEQGELCVVEPRTNRLEMYDTVLIDAGTGSLTWHSRCARVIIAEFW